MTVAGGMVEMSVTTFKAIAKTVSDQEVMAKKFQLLSQGLYTWLAVPPRLQ